jgi:hypothetical protein
MLTGGSSDAGTSSAGRGGVVAVLPDDQDGRLDQEDQEDSQFWPPARADPDACNVGMKRCPFATNVAGIHGK